MALQHTKLCGAKPTLRPHQNTLGWDIDLANIVRRPRLCANPDKAIWVRVQPSG